MIGRRRTDQCNLLSSCKEEGDGKIYSTCKAIIKAIHPSSRPSQLHKGLEGWDPWHVEHLNIRCWVPPRIKFRCNNNLFGLWDLGLGGARRRCKAAVQGGALLKPAMYSTLERNSCKIAGDIHDQAEQKKQEAQSRDLHLQVQVVG